ncbi:MAG: class I SAM-dependent methyltransferase [Nitrospinaceae bacterium]|nr:class I SAM-dependent methyltransferase [Nitrospina sp.]MBT5377158.1 class I SAM-dependent methyltransferase [Nitrospinaceae bacterium]MBT5869072.1 class I SAM-dependent methyltransferase [Nitrospinaceae bacterium]
MSAKPYDSAAKYFDLFRAGDMRRWGQSQQALFKNLKGKVLYIGIGTGQEIVNFPPQLDITAVDLSYEMLRRSDKRVQNYDGKIKRCQMDAQTTAFADNSFDSILTVCVLCSVKHPVPCLQELKRVLKPEGELLMFEHVLSHNPIYALILKSMSHITEYLEGTYLDRDTVSNVEKAGFKIHSHQNIYLDIVKALIARH